MIAKLLGFLCSLLSQPTLDRDTSNLNLHLRLHAATEMKMILKKATREIKLNEFHILVNWEIFNIKYPVLMFVC